MVIPTKRPTPGVPPAPGGGAAPGWRPLYRAAGLAALATAVLIPIAIAAFALWPPPRGATAADWFALFQKNWFLGLVSLDLPFLVVNALTIPVMLALYVALRPVSPSLTTLAVAAFLIGVPGLFAANPSVEMLSLSDRYAAAATGAERAALLGAGEALLAAFQGTAFHAYYVLGQLAGIAFGAVMLRTDLFSKWTAHLMIAGNALGFGLYVPGVGLVLSTLSGVVLWAWSVLITPRLFQLGRAA